MGPELIWPNITGGENAIYEEILIMTGVRHTVSVAIHCSINLLAQLTP